ncbi:MAG: DUF4982 domain-containing protein [Armatimonadetes bacterium]|nr:DUF4982 domain-containing protein [Armatimonadota bacterium]MDE2207824.1 DUF4982 domain-containing protein [Armatimonadota bacterium]
MNRTLWHTAALALLIVFLPLNTVANAITVPPAGRQRIRLDAGWRFHLTQQGQLAHGVAIRAWRWKEDDAPHQDVASMTAADLDVTGSDWHPASTGEDVFHGRVGFVWMRTALPAVHGTHRVLRFAGVDDNATVYLNGRKLVHHEGWNDPFDVLLDAAWNPAGPNVLAVLVENTAGMGGIIGAVTLGVPLPDRLGEPQLAGYNDRSWRVVHLPNDYVVQGKFSPLADTGHGSLPVQPAWYRKTFQLPSRDIGKSVWIYFEGVYRDARVWLNGRFLGEHPSGYTGFRFDISHAVHFGTPNELAVSVDPRHFEGWWYEGGGIYRHVWLTVANPVHVEPWGTFVSTSLPEPTLSDPDPNTRIMIHTAIRNASHASASIQLVSRIVDDRGVEVASISSGQTAVRGLIRASQQIRIAHPRLWSLSHPRMYRLITALVERGRTIDQVTTPFGIRTIRFSADDGFFLNGKRVEIQGVCNHQDYAGVGIAVPDNLEAWRVERLKSIGCNAWRMSHNPPNPELLDACDRLGMLVMDENRHLGDTFEAKTPYGTPYSDMSELDSMVRRDRNHPSIIMWSMCNEEGLQTTQFGARIFAAMRAETLRLDPTRPVTCAMNTGAARGIALIEDIRGFNYGPGVYTSYHARFPNTPLYGSEIGSTTTTRGIYKDDRAKGYVNAYDAYPPWATSAEDTWAPIGSQPFMAGGYVWTGFDYKGEPTPYGWPCINSHFGLLDMCGFRKDDAFYYESVWQQKPMVHIFPHWNWQGENGRPIEVWAYSDADSVELFLNGKSLGRKSYPRFHHVQWSVPYEPGTLLAKAYTNGVLVAQDRVETTGPPAALVLKTTQPKIAADSEEVSVVLVYVVDSRGRVVPTAANRITFHVTGEGRVVGVGNGDPSDHEPDQAATRLAFNGKCMVLAGRASHAGRMIVTAQSPGLKSARLALTAAP